MEVSHLKAGKSPKNIENKKNPAISMTAGFAKYGPNGVQNFLKNTVISTVFDFQTTKFLACNFIFSHQIQGDC